MKKHIRCAASWTCYQLGDLVARLSYVLPDWRILEFIYRPYNRLMCWSSDLDTGECGLWHDVPNSDGL